MKIYLIDFFGPEFALGYGVKTHTSFMSLENYQYYICTSILSLQILSIPY